MSITVYRGRSLSTITLRFFLLLLLLVPFASIADSHTVGYIAVDQRDAEISQGTWLYVKKALEYYKEKKPSFIILRLNTPGGQVFAAQQISDALRDIDLVDGIHVVAYIDDWAISAGAMVAFSCRYIVAAENGSMGAAEPVMATSSGEMEAASEKVNSAIRTDFGNRARIFGRNADIAEAMVDKDTILVWRGDAVVKLDSMEQVHYGGEHPDTVINAKGKLLTLNAQQMVRYGIANDVVPLKPLVLTAEEVSTGRWPAKEMALWQAPLFKDMPDAVVDAYTMDWKTRFFVFLMSPVVSSALFTIMLIAVYMEFNHPGFGVPGTIAVTCLVLIALASFSLEVANWLEIIFLVVGALFIALEFLALPTGGLLAGIGVLFFLAGFFGMLLPSVGKIGFEWQTGTWNAAGEAFLQQLGWLCGGFLVAIAIMMLIGRYLAPRFYGWNRFVLRGGEQDATLGFTAAGNSILPAVGSSGVVTSALRPSGRVVIDDKLYQAISEGDFIGEGTAVNVVRVEGMTLFVRIAH